MKRIALVRMLIAVVIVGDSISGCGAHGSGRKPASTATAVGVIIDQVNKGNVDIKGDPDPAPPP